MPEKRYKQTLEDGWNDFFSTCYGDRVPVGSFQWVEGRKCFYAGARQVTTGLFDLDDAGTEEEMVAYLQRTDEELNNFILKMTAEQN